MSSTVQQLNKRTKSIFEIISAHYVDIFYNHLYLLAKKEFTQTSYEDKMSVTDVYKRLVVSYRYSVHQDGVMVKILQELHEYFKQHTKYTLSTFSQFVDEVLKSFIPEEFFDLIKTEDKDKIFTNIIGDVLQDMGIQVVSPQYLAHIIDHRGRNTQVVIRRLQDLGINILLSLRSNIYLRFYTTPKMIDNLNQQNIVNRLTSENHDLTMQLKAANKQINHLIAQKNQLETDLVAIKTEVYNNNPEHKENNLLS
uniref:D5b-0034 homolog protein n=1 Tax=Abalone asfa-like virus TaxID=2839893 RepID=A0A5K7XY34_9VIRU|nr:D5b-0034 homolog protein [Abalone asfa-like virus]BCY04563.1 hypothetical protein [Abalone asfa-like virus]